MLTYVHMAENQQKVWDEPTKMQYAHNNNGEKKMHFSCVKIAATTNAKKKSGTHAHTHRRNKKKKSTLLLALPQIKTKCQKNCNANGKEATKKCMANGVWGSPLFCCIFFRVQMNALHMRVQHTARTTKAATNACMLYNKCSCNCSSSNVDVRRRLRRRLRQRRLLHWQIAIEVQPKGKRHQRKNPNDIEMTFFIYFSRAPSFLRSCGGIPTPLFFWLCAIMQIFFAFPLLFYFFFFLVNYFVYAK